MTDTTGWNIDRGSWHFHRQLFMRTKIVLRYGEYSAIRRAIKTGQAEMLDWRPAGDRRSAYAVPFRDKTLFVVAHHGRLITVLPTGNFERREEGWRLTPRSRRRRAPHPPASSSQNPS